MILLAIAALLRKRREWKRLVRIAKLEHELKLPYKKSSTGEVLHDSLQFRSPPIVAHGWWSLERHHNRFAYRHPATTYTMPDIERRYREAIAS